MLNFKDTELPNIIDLQNIKQSYDGGKTWILQDLAFLIEDKPEQGQFATILGPSGCGKSTVLRYVAGLQDPTDGQVLLKGNPVGKDNRVSMVFQQYSSLPWMTVLDNVSLALRYKVGALDVGTRLQMQDLLLQLWMKFHPTIIFVTHDISEAVYLADDIYIMKKAPSRFVERINVDLPYPRSRATKREPRFEELVHRVEDKMVEVATAKE